MWSDGSSKCSRPRRRLEPQPRGFEPTVLELDLESLQKRFRGVPRTQKAERRLPHRPRDPRCHSADAQAQGGSRPDRCGTELAARSTGTSSTATANERILSTAWKGSDTDPDILARQSQLAESVMLLARGRIADPQRFAEAMSGDRTLSDEQLTAAADMTLARLRAEAPTQLQSLADQPLTTVASTLRDGAALIREAAAITTDVDGIRGRAGSIASALQAAATANRARDLRGELREDIEAHNLSVHVWRSSTTPIGCCRPLLGVTDAAATLARVPSQSAAERLCLATPDGRHLAEALDRWRDTLRPLLAEFDMGRRKSVAENLEADFTDGLALIDDLAETRGDIQTWIDFRAAAETMSSLGLGRSLEFASGPPDCLGGYCAGF